MFSQYRCLSGLVSFFQPTYWEYKRDSSSHGLAAIQLRGGAEPKPLFSIGLPADDGSSVEKDFDGIAGWERGNDSTLLGVDAGLGTGGRGRDGRGLVWAVWWYCQLLEDGM
jgi:hypothetical protein